VPGVSVSQASASAAAIRPADTTQGLLGGGIRRITLHEQIVARVRDMIIDGSLAPGSRIVETALGAQLGVSRTPLREALKTLASEGLIDVQPGRGAIVHRDTPDQARDVLEVLMGIEAVAARLATVRASDDEIAEVRALHETMRRHFQRGERLAYYKLNLEIHARIGALSHNPELVALHKQYRARVERLRYSGSATHGMWLAAMAEHDAMIDALEARDADRLAEVVRDHMRLIWERLKETM
jgi:DNA-binding GntR family transcriptional regulator